MKINDIKKDLEDLSLELKIEKSLNVINKAFEDGIISEDLLEKAKYIKRTGSKGNYKYIYAEGKGSRGKIRDSGDNSTTSNKITKEELQSLQAYTASDYRKINRAMISGKLTPEIEKEVDSINSALDKMPKFKGELYRGMSMPPNIDNLLIEWGKGKEITMDSFTSTSKKESVAKGFGDFQIKLKSKNGADISSLSEFEDESEVLFKTGSKFKVKSIKIKKLKTPFGDRVMSVNAVLEEI